MLRADIKLIVDGEAARFLHQLLVLTYLRIAIACQTYPKKMATSAALPISDEAAYLTMQNLCSDGGLTLCADFYNPGSA